MNETLTVLQRTSIQGGIALLVVYLVCRFLPRLSPDLRCWLWRAAYLKCLVGLFVAVSVAVPVLPPVVPEAVATVVPMTEQVAETRPTLTTSSDTQMTVSPPAGHVEEVGISTVSRRSDAAAAPVKTTISNVAASTERLSWQSYLVFLYGIGVFAGVIRLGVAAFQTHRLVQRAVPTEHAALPELSRRFGQNTLPRFARSTEISSPLLAFGTILLPAKSNANDEPLIIAHELAHLRRNDIPWEWLGILTQIVLWFHPFVYLARSDERLAREQAADALTLARTAAAPADYARVLLQSSLCRSGRVPVLAVGAVESGSRLRHRLEAIAAPALTHRRTAALGTVAVLLAAVAFVPWRAVAREDFAPRPATSQSTRLKPLANNSTSPTQSAPYVLPSGIVTDRAGKPVPNADVSWMSPINGKQGVLATVQTDSTGKFIFHNAPGIPLETKDRQKFLLRHMGDALMVRTKGYGLAAKELSFAKDGNRIILTPPRTYTVKFTDANHKPVVGLPVWVDALNDFAPWAMVRLKWFGYSGKTDSNGVFEAKGLPNNETIRWDFDHSQHAVLYQEKSGSETKIVLTKGYSLEGTIHLPDGTPAKKQILIQAEPLENTPLPARKSALIDGNGRYRLIGLAAGRYRIYSYFNQNKDLLGAQPTEVNIPKVGRCDLVLQRAGKLFGRVTDTDGKPMPHLEVSNDDGAYWYLEGVKNVSVSTTTDAQGNYEMLAPVGKNSISVERGNTQTVTVPQTGRTQLNFVVSRKSIPTITGRVLDKAGNPVEGIGVLIGNKQHGGMPRTNRDGFFHWKSRIREDSPFTVFVKRGTEGASATVLPGDETPLTLRLSEANVGYFTGQVTDADGTPLRNAIVQFSSGVIYDPRDKPAIDAQGRFRITADPNAKYQIWFKGPGTGTRRLKALYNFKAVETEGSIRETVSVAAGENKDLGRIVLIQGNSTATGILRDSQQKPLVYAHLLLNTPSGEWQGKTDANGWFTIPHVVVGESCSLTVYDGDFRRPRRWTQRGLTVGNMGTITLGDTHK